jgi:hypothetical protein
MKAPYNTPLDSDSAPALALALASMDRKRGYNAALVRVRYTDGSARVHVDGLVRLVGNVFLIHVDGGEGDSPATYLTLTSAGVYEIRIDGKTVPFAQWAEDEWVEGVDLTVFDRAGEPYAVGR